MTENSKEAILVNAKELEQVTYIQYPIAFQGGIIQDSSAPDLMSIFLDLGSQVNAIYPTFAKKLDLVVRSTNNGIQKIDGTTFETYGIVIIALLVIDQANKVTFFEKTFLVANDSPDVVFGMPYFTLIGADVNFQKR